MIHNCMYLTGLDLTHGVSSSYVLKCVCVGGGGGCGCVCVWEEGEGGGGMQ